MSVARVLEVDSYENGTVKYHFDLNLQRLQNITDKDSEIRKRASETIQCINEFLESMRKDVGAYNKSLDDYIGRLLNAKYKKEKEIFDTINSLNIPSMSFTLGKFRFLSRNSLFLQVTQIFSFLSFFIKYHLTKYAKCAAAFVSDEF